MISFNVAVELVLAHEGGFVQDPSDPGGATNFGISQRAHPQVDIAALTREGAIVIYQLEYWKPWMASAATQQLANCLLDCAVNQGVLICQEMYDAAPTLRGLQVARLLHYAHRLVTRPEYMKDAHSWFARTLDVGS